MRIHSGEARGRKLKTREGKGTRPTDARARETLFNIIGERVVEARVLDLYAGTGAVGIEALSRGATSCIFIEQNHVACSVIRENINTLGWQEKAQIWKSAVKPSLRRLGEGGENFDIVFADPPFTREEELHDLATGLDNWCQLLHNEGKRFDGLLVVQHHWKAVPPLSAVWSPVQSRRAGESMLSFYRLAQ